MWPSPVARSIGIGRSPQQFVTGTKLEIPLRAVNDHLIVSASNRFSESWFEQLLDGWIRSAARQQF
jgi:hypothetical protein